MATVKQSVGARTAITVTGLASLANGAYATSAAKDNTTNQPLDILVELSALPGTTSGNKQALLFALASLDGTVYQTGSNASDESDMTLIGSLPLISNGTSQTKVFSTAAAFGGTLPPFVKYVVKNDSGATFSAGTIYTAEVSATVA